MQGVAINFGKLAVASVHVEVIQAENRNDVEHKQEIEGWRNQNSWEKVFRLCDTNWPLRQIQTLLVQIKDNITSLK